MSQIRFKKLSAPPTPPIQPDEVLLYVDADGIPNFEDSAAAIGKLMLEVTGKFRFLGVQHLFNGTTTYTETPGATHYLVVCVGAGGAGSVAFGGASGEVSVGGGGGAGAISWVFSAIVDDHSVSIGAGGLTTGANGGDTTFGNVLCKAKGGHGGAFVGVGSSATQATGGAGGLASGGVGDVTANGADGGHGIRFSGTMGLSGYGAGGPWGGMRPFNFLSSDGQDALAPGAGGSGAISIGPSGGDRPFGKGANGLMIVYEYQDLAP